MSEGVTWCNFRRGRLNKHTLIPCLQGWRLRRLQHSQRTKHFASHINRCWGFWIDLLLWHGYGLCKSGWSHKGLWWRNMSRRSAWRAGWGGHLPQTEQSNSNRLQFCDCHSLWFSIWFLGAPSLAKLCPPGKGGRFNLGALPEKESCDASISINKSEKTTSHQIKRWNR